MPRRGSRLAAAVLAAVAFSPSLAVSSCEGVACDTQFLRAAPGQLEREEALQDAPQFPFQNFSASFVAHALANPVDWTGMGRVTPVKNQGGHGYCGTFGRVGSLEGQWARAQAPAPPVSFSEEELIDCIGWEADQFSCVQAARGICQTDDVYLRGGSPLAPQPRPHTHADTLTRRAS